MVAGFIGAVAADPEINGYFLNASVDLGNVDACLVKQMSALTGAEGATYPGPGEEADADGCRNMKDIHEGMNISKGEFDALVGHAAATVAGALDAAMFPAEQKEAILGVLGGALGGMEGDIVEDAAGDGSIYHRLGGKVGIMALINEFVGLVVANDAINGFFADADAARLTTCLVRQLCDATGGPCIYGEGIEEELGGSACVDMITAHAAINASENPIMKADFDALINDAVTAATNIGVDTASADFQVIAGALSGMCPDIVADAESCK